jgi:hypothetical protein
MITYSLTVFALEHHIPPLFVREDDALSSPITTFFIETKKREYENVFSD